VLLFLFVNVFCSNLGALRLALSCFPTSECARRVSVFNTQGSVERAGRLTRGPFAETPLQQQRRACVVVADHIHTQKQTQSSWRVVKLIKQQLIQYYFTHAGNGGGKTRA